MPDKPCGRLDDHEPHDWTGWNRDDWYAAVPAKRVTYHCTGHLTIEGGHGR